MKKEEEMGMLSTLLILSFCKKFFFKRSVVGLKAPVVGLKAPVVGLSPT
jgi:hypothetical protein